MINPKFTVQSDFVDAFLNRIVLQSKFPEDPIANDAYIFEGCVNLSKMNLNLSECGNKRDHVASFMEANGLAGFKQQVAESCGGEVMEAHSLQFLRHKNSFHNVFSGFLNEVALNDALNTLSQCVNKI
jgi:hypothetical protein